VASDEHELHGAPPSKEPHAPLESEHTARPTMRQSRESPGLPERWA
jgi:hypothetical protein